MRILYLADFEIPSRSAASIHVMRMCAAFAASGHQVTLLAVRPVAKPAGQNVFSLYGVLPVFKMVSFKWPRTPGRSIIYALVAATYILIRKPDLVYSRALPALCLTLWRAKGIMELHRPVWEYGSLYRWLFSRILDSAHLKRVVVISERLRQIHLGKFTSGKYLVAHDGADVPQQSIGNEPELKQHGRFNAGYAGSIYPGRGLDILVQLAVLNPEITFHLIGGTKAELAARVTPNIPENVVCYGYVKPSLVAAYLRKMDVLLAPYQHHTQTIGGTYSADYMSPLKIFEYMSVQKPIIASDLPVLREVLDDTCALLVNSRDIAGWCEALAQLRDPERAQSLAARAFQRLVSRYTWQVRAQWVLNGL